MIIRDFILLTFFSSFALRFDHDDLYVALFMQSSIYEDHCCKTGCVTPSSYLQKVNRLMCGLLLNS